MQPFLLALSAITAVGAWLVLASILSLALGREELVDTAPILRKMPQRAVMPLVSTIGIVGAAMFMAGTALLAQVAL